MSDSTPEPDPAPAENAAPAPVIEEVTPEIAEPTAEEIALANDRDVENELRRLSRRGFITAGAAAAAGLLGYRWLRSRPAEGGVEWPLRRALEFNERLTERWFSDSRMSRRFAPSAVRPLRLNGNLGLDPAFDPSTWKLRIEGSGQPVALTMDDLRRMPRHEVITELRCIEGWSVVVKWAGIRLRDVMAAVPPPARDGSRADVSRDIDRLVRYVALETPDRGYYVGLDMQSAMHPQTLLAYELNNQPLSDGHGAPLRLAIPVKYGIKNIKRIGVIRYTDVRPPDFWAERGYDWYAGF